MKYICLGYIEPGKFESMSESERNTTLDECFSYNDELRKNGHLVAEEPLQPAKTAVTVCWKNGKVAVTDGPYAETKEQLGGIQVLEARDLNHAIQLISQCPGVRLKCGTIEIRPAADINEIDERERAAAAKGHLAVRAARMMTERMIESVQWKALRAAAARARSYSHPSHRSRQSDRRIHPFVWRQSLLPLALSGRAKHPYRPRCS